MTVFDQYAHYLLESRCKDINKLNSIFKGLSQDEQNNVLEIYLNLISNVKEKHEDIKIILELEFLNRSSRRKFLDTIIENANDEVRFLFWLKGITRVKYFNYPVKKLEQSLLECNDEVTSIIFKTISKEEDQWQVLSQLVDPFSTIEINHYRLLLKILHLDDIAPGVKSRLINVIFEKGSDQVNIMCMNDGYLNLGFFADYISSRIIKKELLYKILTILNDEADQLKLADVIIKEKVPFIENKGYRRKIIEAMLLRQCEKKSAFQARLEDKLNLNYKFELWLDGKVEHFDFNKINFTLINENSLSTRRLIIKSAEHQEKLLKSFLEGRKPIDSDYKFDDVQNISRTQGLQKEVLQEFLVNALLNSDQERREKIFFQILNNYPLDRKLAKDYLDNLGIISLFKQLPNFLQYYVKAKSRKERLENALFIKSYLESNANRIENNIRELISVLSVDQIKEFLSLYRDLISFDDKNNDDLIIKSFISSDLEKIIVENFTEVELLQLWLNDLINYFDYDKYRACFYPLDPQDKKRFIRKVKAVMGDQFKNYYLQEKEPWKFIESKNDDHYGIMDIYSASWTSIWFQDGYIKVCKDKNGKFTEPFNWNLSKKEFNFLHKYILRRRFKDLTINVVGNSIVSINGLEDLAEIIYLVEVEKVIDNEGSYRIHDKERILKIPVNILNRNKSLNFLMAFQAEFPPTLIVDKTYNNIKKISTKDFTYLFSIILDENEIALIWESAILEVSKATYIFKCLKSEYEIIHKRITNYLDSKSKVRSYLANHDLNEDQEKQKLRYLGRIYHDNIKPDNWEEEIYKLLPKLRQC